MINFLDVKLEDDYIRWELFEKERLFLMVILSPIFGVPILSPFFLLTIIPEVIQDVDRFFNYELNKEEALSRVLSRFDIE